MIDVVVLPPPAYIALHGGGFYSLNPKIKKMTNNLETDKSYFIGNFKVYMDKDGGLKVTAVGDLKSDIRIEPVSSNNIIIHSL